MKKLLLLFTLALLLSSCTRVKDSQVEQIINSVKQEFCPDKRVAIFDIQAEYNKKEIILKGETSSQEAHEALLNELSTQADFEINDNINVLPDQEMGEENVGVIQISTAHQRREPDVRAEMINQAIMGETVRLLKKDSYYYLAQLPDGYLGWITKSSVNAMTMAELEEWQQSEKVVFYQRHGQIFSQSNTKSQPIGDLVMGAVLQKLAKKGKWIKVSCYKDEIGWVPADQVINIDKKPAATAENIITLAKSFYGIPYLWGGRSAKAFDCSGFVKTVYELHGIVLDRDANMQVKQGKEIAIDAQYSQLQSGDLLFFGLDPEKITHVAIYLGEKKFIHSDGYVHINSFDSTDPLFSEYRTKNLRKVKRIINELD